MVTIRELAERSGVSVATVSRVFNTPTLVSPDSRQRVLDVAADIGYMPNESARTLATKKSNLVGLVWDTDHRRPGWRHPFLQEILAALRIALSGHGLNVLLMSARGAGTDKDTYRHHLHTVRRHNLDGVVFIENCFQDPAVLALTGIDVPCVALDVAARGPQTTYVTSDNEGGARLAARHLVERGHCRIATITGPLHTRPATHRLAGFQAELAAHGLALPPDHIVEGDWYPTGGYAGMTRLLALDPPPTGVFVAGDEMAVGALRAVADAGLRVPHDVAVVGFDDLDLAALMPPGITTVAQDKPGFGTAAATVMVSMLRAGPGAPAPPPTVLPTSLVVRGTT